MPSFPVAPSARDRFVLERRPLRQRHDPWRAQGLVVEDERTTAGSPARTATVFLTGRECPWRCAMCDLWQYTTEDDTPRGAVPAQIAAARDALRGANDPIAAVKLYNAGSFFDPRAVPEADYEAVATLVADLSRVVVESHPSLVGNRTARFLDAMKATAKPGPTPQLEVAMGLETAHPEALERLHKRMTLDDLGRAAGRLRDMGVSVRVFLLISPPFVADEAQDDWLARSVVAAADAGASIVSIIPTRSGNGTIEALAAEGLFRAPRLGDVERSLALALDCVAGRGVLVFADLWDLERLSDCGACFASRRDRLQAMNLGQRALPDAACSACGREVSTV